MKKILFLLLATISMYGQTYPTNPTNFGKIAIKNNSVSTSTSKLNTQDPVTGEVKYIDALNLPMPLSVKDSLIKKQNLPTGFISGLQLSINADPTKVNIAAGYYTITDFTDITNPVVTIKTFAGLTGYTPTYLNIAKATYIALDINGNVVASASPFTNSQRRTLAIIGSAIHSNLTTVNVTNEIKAPIIAPTNQLHDFMRAIGFLNEEGNIFSPNGANLQLNKSAGKIFGMGINAADYTNPHQLLIPAQTALTFAYRLQGGTQLADTQNINPNIYDVGGVSTPTPSNKWTIQRINLFQSGLARIQPGQTVYNSFNDATIALPTQSFVTEKNIVAVFRCYLIVQQGTTNLASAVAGGTAQFIPVDKFGNVIGNGSVALTYSNIVAALGYTPANDTDVVHKTGVETLTGFKTFSPNVSAISAIARGILLSPSLTATANNDMLIGLDINSSYTEGAFTSVNKVSIKTTEKVIVGREASPFDSDLMMLTIKAPSDYPNTYFYIEAPNNTNHFRIDHDGINGTTGTDGDWIASAEKEISFQTFDVTPNSYSEKSRMFRDGSFSFGSGTKRAKLTLTGGESMTGGYTRNLLVSSAYPSVVFESTSPGKSASMSYDGTPITGGMSFFVNAPTIDATAATLTVGPELHIKNEGGVNVRNLQGSGPRIVVTDFSGNVSAPTDFTHTGNATFTGIANVASLSGTGTRQVVADASGNLSATSVQPLKYTALISQTGTNAPVATILENTLGFTPIFSYDVVGAYNISGSTFDLNKTTITLQGSSGFCGALVNTTTQMIIYSFDNTGVLKNDLLSRNLLEIRVYP